MPREISTSIRLEVVRLFFEGFSYDEIAAKLDIAKGSVTGIVQELRDGEFPQYENTLEQVEYLREIAVGLRKLQVSVAEGSGLFILLRRLIETGIEPSELATLVKLFESVPEVEGFTGSRIIQSAVKLLKLEAAGLTYEDTIAKFNSSSAQVKELGEKSDALREEKARLEASRQTLTQACTELEAQKKQIESDCRGLVEKTEQLSGHNRKLELAVQDRETLVSNLENKERELSERVPRLEERTTAIDAEISNRAKVLKEMEELNFPQNALQQLKTGLTQMAAHYGSEDLVARFFEHVAQFDNVLQEGAKKEALEGEVKALVQQRDTMNKLGEKWGLSPDEIAEGMAAVKGLRKQGVPPNAIASYHRVLADAGTDPADFQKLVSEFGALEKALVAKRGDLKNAEDELGAKKRAVDVLKVEEKNVKESITAVRQAGVNEISQVASSVKSEVDKLSLSLQLDIARWGNLRAEMGKYEEEVKMARFFGTLPLSQAALDSFVKELGAPVVLQYLSISRAWCQSQFNPKLKPPHAIIKKYYQIHDYTPVELADVIGWALTMLVGGN